MSEMNWQYAKSLNGFHLAMLNKLETGRNKSSWLNETPEWLLERLREEATELEQALEKRCAQDIRDECADIANFAFFIHDLITEESDIYND